MHPSPTLTAGAHGSSDVLSSCPHTQEACGTPGTELGEPKENPATLTSGTYDHGKHDLDVTPHLERPHGRGHSVLWKLCRWWGHLPQVGPPPLAPCHMQT